MIDSVRRRAAPFLLIAVALAVRLVAGEVVLSKDRAFLPDSELYWGYAESLARNGVYQVGGAGARRTPGYPLFIAGCTKLLGDPNPLVPPPESQLRAVLVAQALLGALVVGMVWSLALALFADEPSPRRAAMIAGLASAIDPFLISVGAMVLSETLFTAALVATVWFAMKSMGKGGNPPIVWTAAAGIAAGVAVLVRPSGLPLAFVGVAALARWWGLRGVTVSTTFFVVALTPWVLRNANVYHAFIPTTLNVGESLYDGWNPDADGGSDMAFVDRRKRMHGPAASPAEEITEDAYWKREAVDWAKSHPGRVLQLAATKIARFWSPWPNAAEFQSKWIVAGCGLFSLVVYGGAIAGIWALMRRRQWHAIVVALTPALYFMALHAIFVSSVRYRVPAMPMLELLTGAGLAWLVNNRSDAEGKEA